MATTLKPLDHNTEINQNGENIIEKFEKKMENVTEEEMLSTLEKQQKNRLWTEEEMACLLYFHGQVKGCFDTLQSKYFKHRTVGALQVRYSKILNGHATPSHTPRPSIGNLSSKGVNSVLNLLTPEVNKEPVKPIDENVEDLLKELEFDDDDEEEENDKPEEETATVEEEENTEVEKTEENVETEVKEEMESGDENMIFFMILPFVVCLIALPLLFLADENPSDNVYVQQLQAHITEIKENIQKLFEQ